MTEKTGIIERLKPIFELLKSLDWKVILIICITAIALFAIYSFSNVEQTRDMNKNVKILNQNTEILNGSVTALTQRLDSYEKTVTRRLDSHDDAISMLIDYFEQNEKKE